MIKYNDLTKDIGEVFFSGHQITEVFIGTSKVFPDSPTPPPTPVWGKYRFTLEDQSVVSADCDASSAITSAETTAYGGTMIAAEIGDCVTSIADSTFSYYFRKLTSITISNSVTSIGNGAFYGCTGLTNVTIPDSVANLDDGVFNGCSNLVTVTLPSGLTIIPEATFRICSSLTEVNIPSCVTSIGYQAFNQCISLTSITIPSSVTSIGGYAFVNCTSLSSITIPNAVATIEDYAFKGCNGLTSITIGSGITNIKQEAFFNCSGLTSITVNAVTPPTLGSSAFYNTNECPIYVPAESVNAYKGAWVAHVTASRIQPIP